MSVPPVKCSTLMGSDGPDMFESARSPRRSSSRGPPIRRGVRVIEHPFEPFLTLPASFTVAQRTYECTSYPDGDPVWYRTSMAKKRRRLGTTGLTVSELCLGTMTFGNHADEATSLRILDRAFDGGIDFLDVAELYPVPPKPESAGRSETIIGQWLKDKPRDSIVIATKVAGPGGGWFVPPVRGGRTALDRHHIERAVEASLKRLGTDYIDLYQTHWPDPELPIEVTLEGLDRVIRAGKVRYIGASNETAYGLTRALYTSKSSGLPRYETIQNNFSLLNRRFEDELSNVCRREKVSLIPYSPLAGGVLSGKYNDGKWPEPARFSTYRNDPNRGREMTQRFINEKTLATTERISKLAAELSVSPVTFAIAWTLSHDFVASSIVGATRVEQLEEILAAGELKLPSDVLGRVDEITREILYPMG
jgi:aryl-alcohol dehydrogenase-like predicted oxidoreductase